MATRLLLATGWVRGDRVRSHAGWRCASAASPDPVPSEEPASASASTVVVTEDKPDPPPAEEKSEEVAAVSNGGGSAPVSSEAAEEDGGLDDILSKLKFAALHLAAATSLRPPPLLPSHRFAPPHPHRPAPPPPRTRNPHLPPTPPPPDPKQRQLAASTFMLDDTPHPSEAAAAAGSCRLVRLRGGRCAPVVLAVLAPRQSGDTPDSVLSSPSFHLDAPDSATPGSDVPSSVGLDDIVPET
ncbi:hypothetical protein DAI22_02g202600 [Oryza sativa Japonica Group]|nr:hypothetical protein DAI22_02g202600 [Oryza sativa Japonica Group]